MVVGAILGITYDSTTTHNQLRPSSAPQNVGGRVVVIVVGLVVAAIPLVSIPGRVHDGYNDTRRHDGSNTAAIQQHVVSSTYGLAGKQSMWQKPTNRGHNNDTSFQVVDSTNPKQDGSTTNDDDEHNQRAS